ncbi:CsxC family protein [Bacillus alkalisoli]|uniref:CsxC family protein n=1 Tax=Bacillus alkalisoli TaxID=2011008 RepID=UPI000C23817C|nr:hypothetical protein [Bacillus alkalisoli]
MRRNTSCNQQKGCPPAQPCDTAKTKRVDSSVDSSAPQVVEVQDVPVIDVPVVLAEVELFANVEADIHLPTAAREIKVIRKNISLKQCESHIDRFRNNIAKVYVTGVVHKNIQYVESCSGYVKDYSVDVPFSFNQEVEIFNPAQQFFSNKSSLTEEYRYLDKSKHGATRCKSGSFTFEYYNEPIECKLLYSDIFELDLYKDFDRFGRFNKVTEKMEIFLALKLLQTQQLDPRKYVPCTPKTIGQNQTSPLMNKIKNRMNRA